MKYDCRIGGFDSSEGMISREGRNKSSVAALFISWVGIRDPYLARMRGAVMMKTSE